jgi:hypothetical protein
LRLPQIIPDTCVNHYLVYLYYYMRQMSSKGETFVKIV